MSPTEARQPDQGASPWDRRVAASGSTFEPLPDAFAAEALESLSPLGAAPLARIERDHGTGRA